MKENLTLAWIATLFAIVGQLLFFIIIAIYTGEWRFVMWSFIVSMSVGVPSLIRLAGTKTYKSKQKLRGGVILYVALLLLIVSVVGYFSLKYYATLLL